MFPVAAELIESDETAEDDVKAAEGAPMLVLVLIPGKDSERAGTISGGGTPLGWPEVAFGDCGWSCEP